ncbi:MAG: 50S ribosomal protein L25 [Gemmataceae bacterium]
MSETVTLTVQSRGGKGSRKAAKLRKQGLLPGVVYGHKQDVAQVSLNYEEFDRAVRKQHARALTISLNGKSETVLIKELQWDHLGQHMVHVDLWRVDKDETVKVVVPVELRGAPKSMGGGVLDQPLHTLHVECLAIAIPDSIRIDITNLTLGNPVHVRELNLPAGVKVLEAPEAVVVQIKLAGLEPTTPTEATGAEPEVLTAKKPKEGEEE